MTNADTRPARDPMLAAQGYSRADEDAYVAYCEEAEDLYEAEQVNGLTGPCEACGEWSVLVSYVTTLGYAGHPGEERSGLYTCVNPECQHVELAG